MLNQVILVGKLVNELELKEGENGQNIITLSIPRNSDGLYETDLINCVLFGNIAKNTAEYCNKGDTIGIKGRMQNENGQQVVIAEKVTFLSSKKENE